jgi:hypothetical protein
MSAEALLGGRLTACTGVVASSTATRFAGLATAGSRTRKRVVWLLHQKEMILNMSALTKLEGTLLAIGGQKAIELPAPYPDIVLARGRVFGPEGRRRVRGRPHCGPRNVALFYAMHHAFDLGDIYEIATGYALCKGGVWLPHSWLWDGDHITEMSRPPQCYFGAILEPTEVVRFVLTHVIPMLPGARDFFEQSLAGREAA